MHELGHTLGLDHGGTDFQNCKPNYVSVMNYDHQLGIIRKEDPGPMAGPCNDGVDNSSDGFTDIVDPDCSDTQDLDGNIVPDGVILDFSPPRTRTGRGGAQLPVGGNCPIGGVPCLIENALLETTVFDMSDPDNMMIFVPTFSRQLGEDGFGPNTCGNGVDDGRIDGLMDATDPDCRPIKTAAALDTPVDWSGDGMISPAPVQVDVDRGGRNGFPADCQRNNLGVALTPLLGADDWSNLDLPVRASGSKTPIQRGPEPTLEQLRRQRLEVLRIFADLSLSIDPPSGADAGAELDLEFMLRNAGPRDARQVRSWLHLPVAVEFVSASIDCAVAADASIECAVGEIDVNSERTVRVRVRVQPDPDQRPRSIRAEVRDGATEDLDRTNNQVAFELNLNPDCSEIEAEPEELWPPNHQLRPIQIDGATDPDGDEVTLAVTAVRQDEPVAGPGKHDPDAELDARCGVSVRPERDGQGDGRVYHLSLEATDSRGGSCTTTRTLCVPHDQARACVDQGPLYDSLAR